jgi:hypothetical protein
MVSCWKCKFNTKLRNKYTDGNIVKVSDTLIDNILVQFNGGICQQADTPVFLSYKSDGHIPVLLEVALITHNAC